MSLHGQDQSLVSKQSAQTIRIRTRPQLGSTANRGLSPIILPPVVAVLDQPDAEQPPRWKEFNVAPLLGTDQAKQAEGVHRA